MTLFRQFSSLVPSPQNYNISQKEFKLKSLINVLLMLFLSFVNKSVLILLNKMTLWIVLLLMIIMSHFKYAKSIKIIFRILCPFQAATNGLLWAMDRQTFRKIVLRNAFQKRKMYESLLEGVPLLNTLSVSKKL